MKRSVETILVKAINSETQNKRFTRLQIPDERICFFKSITS